MVSRGAVNINTTYLSYLMVSFIPIILSVFSLSCSHHASCYAHCPHTPDMKMTLRAYIGLLRMEDSLYNNEYYTEVGQWMVG